MEVFMDQQDEEMLDQLRHISNEGFHHRVQEDKKENYYASIYTYPREESNKAQNMKNFLQKQGLSVEIVSLRNQGTTLCYELQFKQQPKEEIANIIKKNNLVLLDEKIEQVSKETKKLDNNELKNKIDSGIQEIKQTKNKGQWEKVENVAEKLKSLFKENKSPFKERRGYDFQSEKEIKNPMARIHDLLHELHKIIEKIKDVKPFSKKESPTSIQFFEISNKKLQKEDPSPDSIASPTHRPFVK